MKLGQDALQRFFRLLRRQGRPDGCVRRFGFRILLRHKVRRRRILSIRMTVRRTVRRNLIDRLRRIRVFRILRRILVVSRPAERRHFVQMILPNRSGGDPLCIAVIKQQIGDLPQCRGFLHREIAVDQRGQHKKPSDRLRSVTAPACPLFGIARGDLPEERRNRKHPPRLSGTVQRRDHLRRRTGLSGEHRKNAQIVLRQQMVRRPDPHRSRRQPAADFLVMPILRILRNFVQQFVQRLGNLLIFHTETPPISLFAVLQVISAYDWNFF